MSMSNKMRSAGASVMLLAVTANYAEAAEKACFAKVKCKTTTPAAPVNQIKAKPKKIVAVGCPIAPLHLNLSADAAPENQLRGHMGLGQSVLEPLSQAMGPGLTVESEQFIERGLHRDDGLKSIVDAFWNPINKPIALNSATEGLSANLEIGVDCNREIQVGYGEMQGTVTRTTVTANGQGWAPTLIQGIATGFGIYFGFRQLHLLTEAVNQTVNVSGNNISSLFGGGCADIINVNSTTKNNDASCNVNSVFQNSQGGNGNGLSSTGGSSTAKSITISMNDAMAPEALRRLPGVIRASATPKFA